MLRLTRPPTYVTFNRCDPKGRLVHTNGTDEIEVPVTILTGASYYKRFLDSANFEIIGDPEATQREVQKYKNQSPRILSVRPIAGGEVKLHLKRDTRTLAYRDETHLFDEPIEPIEQQDYISGKGTAQLYASRANIVTLEFFQELCSDGTLQGFRYAGELRGLGKEGSDAHQRRLFLLSEVNGLNDIL